MKQRLLQHKLPQVPMAKQGRVQQQESELNACRESSQEKSREAAVLCLLLAPWADLLSLGPRECVPICIHRPSTGEPDAGNPPVRFGGRGEVNPSSLPLFICRPPGWELRLSPSRLGSC